MSSPIPSPAVPVVHAALALAVGAAPAAVVLTWAVRRTEERADAAEAVSGAALASALETLAEHRYVAEATGPSRLLAYHPPLTERITRLRAQADRVGARVQ